MGMCEFHLSSTALLAVNLGKLPSYMLLRFLYYLCLDNGHRGVYL